MPPPEFIISIHFLPHIEILTCTESHPDQHKIAYFVAIHWSDNDSMHLTDKSSLRASHCSALLPQSVPLFSFPRRGLGLLVQCSTGTWKILHHHHQMNGNLVLQSHFLISCVNQEHMASLVKFTLKNYFRLWYFLYLLKAFGISLGLYLLKAYNFKRPCG